MANRAHLHELLVILHTYEDKIITADNYDAVEHAIWDYMTRVEKYNNRVCRFAFNTMVFVNRRIYKAYNKQIYAFLINADQFALEIPQFRKIGGAK